MKAVVMAGGEGTRLRPLTCNLPKPMVPILNIPIMHHGLNLLRTHGIQEVCATLQYLPKKIMDYFGDGKDIGMDMHYFIEDKPLGTAGSVKNACKDLKETFIVFSGDALCDIDLTDALNFHKSKGALATQILKRAEIPLEYGVVVTDNDGRIIRFLEKPTWREVFSDTVNTGIYILEPEVLDEIASGEVKDFSKNIFPALLKKGIPLFGYITQDYWCDIGGIGSYIQAHYDGMSGRCKLPLISDMKNGKDGLWVGKYSVLPEDIDIELPCFIGNNVRFGENTKIGAYTVLGNNTVIGAGSSLKKTILWDGAILGNHVEARGAVICRHVSLEDRSRIFEGAVIGDDSIAGVDTYIKSNILIWPEKVIEEGCTVSENVVWDGEGKKGIDIYEGVIRFKVGALLPERIVAFARAYGSCLGEDTTILLCEDGTVPSLLVKQALTAGLMSQGILCHDIGTNPYQTACITLCEYPYKGGICVYFENEMCHILLLSVKGVPISKDTERKIQNIYERRDVLPCRDAACIKKCQYIEGANEKALSWIIDQLDTSVFYKNKPIVAVSDNAPSGFMEKCLKAAGCKLIKIDMNRFDYRMVIESSDCLFDVTQLNYYGESNLLLMARDGLILDPIKLLGLKVLLLKRIDSFNKALLPVNAPDELVYMCKENGIEPVFTKISERDMMQCVRDLYPENDIVFGVYFLNTLFVLKLVEHLLKERMNLEQMLAMIPKYHHVQKEVSCTPKDYGRVMRSLAQQTEIGDIPEGVKLNADNGWALVLPNLETRSLRIFGHGVSEEYASDISERTMTQVQKCLNKNLKETDN